MAAGKMIILLPIVAILALVWCVGDFLRSIGCRIPGPLDLYNTRESPARFGITNPQGPAPRIPFLAEV